MGSWAIRGRMGCLGVCVYVYIYVCVCVYICIYVYIYTYMHVYIYTYMHACRQTHTRRMGCLGVGEELSCLGVGRPLEGQLEGDHFKEFI